MKAPLQMIWTVVPLMIACAVVLRVVVHHRKRGRWWLTLANIAAFTFGSLAAVGLAYVLGLFY